MKKSGFTKEKNGCWTWTGSLCVGARNTYGRIHVNGRVLRAHRYLYEIHVRKLKRSEVLHHDCRNTLCVNPKHLIPMSNGENVKIGYDDKRKTVPVKSCERCQKAFRPCQVWGRYCSNTCSSRVRMQRKAVRDRMR